VEKNVDLSNNNTIMAYTDLTYLKEITGGEAEIIREMIEMFLAQVDEFKENLEKHLADENWVELGKEAHKAKSSVLIVGMEDLGKNLKKLQLLTEEGKEIDTYPDYVAMFNEQCDAAVTELQDELNNL
jgi:HPt (histidine-containing phosphotransfer) domain-containing protein